MKESWPKMFCRQCRQNVLRHVCYSKSSNKLEAEHRLLEMDHKNRMSINWLHTVCRPWAGQSAQRHGKSLQSCPILCDPMDCSPPGSSAHGILQARILEWVAMLYSGRTSRPRDQTCISRTSCIAGGFSTTEPPGKPLRSLGLWNLVHIPLHVFYTTCSNHPESESEYNVII